MKSALVHIEKNNNKQRVLVIYETKKELADKLLILSNQCEKNDSRMYINSGDFNIETI